MSEHKFNPQAVAKQNGHQMVRVLDLGDGVALAGWELGALMRQAGTAPCSCGDPSLEVHAADCASLVAPPLVAVCGLFAVGGRQSPLQLGMELRRVLVGELGVIPVEELRRLLTQEAPPAEGEPT